jgi:hypothetical protein
LRGAAAAVAAPYVLTSAALGAGGGLGQFVEFVLRVERHQVHAAMNLTTSAWELAFTA